MESNKKDSQKTKFEKFETMQIHRSQIKNAPYNPRIISEEAKKRLKENLKRVGLVAPITWNKRTGNIVGGHQRIAALDALEKSKDYILTVAVVDLDEKTEREQNIFLNNPSAQGDWDILKLGEILRDTEIKIDIDNTGFDMGEIYQLLGENPIKELPEEMARLADELHTRRESYAKQLKRINERDQVDFYLVVIFRTNEDREAFTKKLNLPDNRYVDGRLLERLLENKTNLTPR